MTLIRTISPNGSNTGLQPLFNPIALRMAKTLWSFGHSECYRVKIRNKIIQDYLQNPTWFGGLIHTSYMLADNVFHHAVHSAYKLTV